MQSRKRINIYLEFLSLAKCANLKRGLFDRNRLRRIRYFFYKIRNELQIYLNLLTRSINAKQTEVSFYVRIFRLQPACYAC